MELRREEHCDIGGFRKKEKRRQPCGVGKQSENLREKNQKREREEQTKGGKLPSRGG